MVPSTSTSATAVLKDAVTNFVQAANQALALAEESSKSDLSLALQNQREVEHERDELRREKDKLLKEKIDMVVELESTKREVERWKASSEKAEWMIDHQAETVAQLRREAQQWKDQLMRVEEERARLSTRVDELVAQQLFGRDAHNVEPLTPRSQGPQLYASVSTLSKRGASTSTSQQHTTNTSSSISDFNGYVTDNDVSGRLSRLSTGRPPQSQVSSTSTVVSRKKSTRGAVQHSSSSKHNASYSQPPQASSSRTTGKQTVIRRVHAVVEVPVKEESIDPESMLMEAQARSQSVDVEESSVSYSDGVEADRRDVNNSASTRRGGRPRAEGKAYQNGAGRRFKDGSTSDEDYYAQTSRRDDDDEDELMLGSEDYRREMYGSEELPSNGLQTPPAPRRAQTQAHSGKTSGSSGKKRSSPYPATVSKKTKRR